MYVQPGPNAAMRPSSSNACGCSSSSSNACLSTCAGSYRDRGAESSGPNRPSSNTSCSNRNHPSINHNHSYYNYHSSIHPGPEPTFRPSARQEHRETGHGPRPSHSGQTRLHHKSYDDPRDARDPTSQTAKAHRLPEGGEGVVYVRTYGALAHRSSSVCTLGRVFFVFLMCASCCTFAGVAAASAMLAPSERFTGFQSMVERQLHHPDETPLHLNVTASDILDRLLRTKHPSAADLIPELRDDASRPLIELADLMTESLLELQKKQRDSCHCGAPSRSHRHNTTAAVASRHRTQ